MSVAVHAQCQVLASTAACAPTSTISSTALKSRAARAGLRGQRLHPPKQPRTRHHRPGDGRSRASPPATMTCTELGRRSPRTRLRGIPSAGRPRRGGHQPERSLQPVAQRDIFNHRNTCALDLRRSAACRALEYRYMTFQLGSWAYDGGIRPVDSPSELVADLAALGLQGRLLSTASDHLVAAGRSGVNAGPRRT